MFFRSRSNEFHDRIDAGRRLAEKLESMNLENPVILALPRGGVPVAFEVAKCLKAPLDLLMVRKIGAPMNKEFAIGAVVDGPGPMLVLNENARQFHLNREYMEEEMRRQLAEIERRRPIYFKGRKPEDVRGRTVIIIDDGIATGSTARVALKALQQKNAKRIILAVPVGPGDTVEDLRSEGCEVLCLSTPPNFCAVGNHYEVFNQTEDEEVIKLMDAAREWIPK
ncbi:phosphoribosyl transferase domain-containing protein [Ditylenchus destructor]|uniref:Phosphoribosyl transferase domain-containing protein n=1 Tax=Ditylenchus destructor TaxID=166010 RepID=A0AAD4NAG0_9BILA|nr:phosphoribosyl transferase domain-containing protein [Ditylenchus destructor]